MPKIHAYVDGRGHYIKTAFDGNIVTFQLTPQGEEYLRQKRWRDGASISTDQLIYMQKRRMLYTGGSGPGEIEPALFARRMRGGGRKSRRGGRRSQSRKKKSGCGCCGAIAFGLLALPVAAAWLVTKKWKTS